MSLERDVAVKNKKLKIQQAILRVVATAGILAVAVVAPNALSVLGKMVNAKGRAKTKVSLSRLVEKGFVEFKNRDGKKFLVLTKTGTAYLRRLELKNFSLKKPSVWDGKWRVIIFDIPEKKGKLRYEIRAIFGRVGFRRLQDSVWIYPYDCEDFVTLLKLDLFVGKDMLYMIVEKLENDKHLKEDFGLNS